MSRHDVRPQTGPVGGDFAPEHGAMGPGLDPLADRRSREPSGVEGSDAANVVEARLVEAGLALAVVAVLAQTAVHLTNGLLLDSRYWFFNADVETTAFSWASTAATFGAALLLAIVEVVRGALWTRQLLCAVAIAFLSLDDAVQVHERIGEAVGSELLRGVASDLVIRGWVVLYVPLLFAICVVLLGVVRELGESRAARLLAGGVVLLAAALALELAGLGTRWLARNGTTWPETLQVALEEGAELAGWILIATALAVRLAVVSARSGGPRL